MILHVPARIDRAYLFSLPRDLLVDIPAFPKADYHGGTGKLNAAMSYGSRVPGGGKPGPRPRASSCWPRRSPAYTGIERFDAGAIINFTGFKKIVDAMGGVTMYIDAGRRTPSTCSPTATPRPSNAQRRAATRTSARRREYKKGTHHLKGWQALDYVRQRYDGCPTATTAGSGTSSSSSRRWPSRRSAPDVVTNPLKLDKVLRAAGQSLIFNGRGHSVADFGLGAAQPARKTRSRWSSCPGGGVGTGERLPGRGSSTPGREELLRRGAATARSTRSWSPTRN